MSETKDIGTNERHYRTGTANRLTKSWRNTVNLRNNLRGLEQKVNASDKLSEADKFDLQQYITRCYGSLTTFNILFKNKDDQFRTGAADRPNG